MGHFCFWLDLLTHVKQLNSWTSSMKQWLVRCWASKKRDSDPKREKTNDVFWLCQCYQERFSGPWHREEKGRKTLAISLVWAELILWGGQCGWTLQGSCSQGRAAYRAESPLCLQLGTDQHMLIRKLPKAGGRISCEDREGQSQNANRTGNIVCSHQSGKSHNSWDIG